MTSEPPSGETRPTLPDEEQTDTIDAAPATPGVVPAQPTSPPATTPSGEARQGERGPIYEE